MKKHILIVGILLLAVMIQFCGHRIYTDPVFIEKTNGHRVIAVLPFEMIFTGKQPKKLNPQQIQKIEEVESIAFQNSLYHALFHQTTRYRYPVRIDIQPVEKTNRILDKHNIGIRDSWDIDSDELARLLRVDAVVRTRVEKRRYMSGLASFGIEVGNIILNTLLEDSPLSIFVPNPTKRIKAGCYLYNGRDGAVLWGFDVVDEADWTLPANAVMDGVNHHFAKRFPYR
ncbi:MAG: hypothetical protein GY950_03630 [bacterium]|nr:hypothetical protein [bacterium]